MVLSLDACGAPAAGEGGEGGQPAATTTEAAPAVQEVTIGDYHVVFKGAYEYGSNEFGDNFIVLVDFTNNAAEAYKPNTRVYIEVKQGDKLLKGIEWQEKDYPIPELAQKDYFDVAPGESTSYYNGFQFDPEGGIITVTFMDNFHQIKDKLVVELDPATLTTYQAP
jgi:hypothetical protein